MAPTVNRPRAEKLARGKVSGMTVDSIEVKNFQSIEKGKVELGKFTVLTGPSSSGKSAFLRAAQAIVRNNFTPSQVRQGSTQSELGMEVAGHHIKAIRGKSKSTYMLDEEEYTKAGRTVPTPVADVLSMPEVAEVEATFSGQFDKPYLVADPGSVAAKVLGTLTNVSVLHGGLRETNRRSLEARSSLKGREVDLEGVALKLEAFEDLDVRLNKLSAAQEAYESLQTLEVRVKAVEAAMANLQRLAVLLKESISSQPDLTRMETITSSVDLPKLKELARAVEQVVRSQTSLDSLYVPETSGLVDLLTKATGNKELIQDLTSAVGNLISLKQQVKELGRMKELPDSPDIRPLKELNAYVFQIQAKASELKEVLGEVSEFSKKIQENESERATLLEGYSTCPICGNSIEGEHLD